MCIYCKNLKHLRDVDKQAYQYVLDCWKRAYERQEKLLRRALLCIKIDEDRTLMSDILEELTADFIKGGDRHA